MQINFIATVESILIGRNTLSVCSALRYYSLDWLRIMPVYEQIIVIVRLNSYDMGETTSSI